MRSRSLHVLCLTVMTAACDPSAPRSEPAPGPTIPDAKPVFSALDIGEARALFIVPGPNGLSDRLFQLTASDQVREVPQRFVDAAGAPLPGASPLWITDLMDAGPDYVLLATLTLADPPSGLWLVRKRDGAVFQLPASFFVDRVLSGFMNAPHVQVDGRGRIHLLTYPRGSLDVTNSALVRIDPADPAHPVLATLVPLSDIRRFAVSTSGDVFFTQGPPESPINRVLLAGGEALDAPMDDVWVGLDGGFCASEGLQLERLTISPAGVTSRPIGDRLSEWAGASGYLLSTRDTQFILQGARITAVDGAAPFTPRAWPLRGYGGVRGASASDTALYLAATKNGAGTTLARWVPDGTLTELLPPGAYEVLSFAPTRNGTVLLNATRASDGKAVIATLDAGGALAVLDETLGAVRDLLWLRDPG